AEASQDFQGQVMRAENGFRLEFPELTDKFVRCEVSEGASEASKLFDQGGVIGLFENVGVKFGSVFDDLYVAIDVDFAIQPRGKGEHIKALEEVFGTEGAPGLFEGGGGLDMSGPSGDGG